MKLDVERLTSEPTPFAFEGGTAWWRSHMPAQPGLPREVAEPFVLTGNAYRGSGEEILLEGSVSGALELECARCLARYRHALHEPFRLVLEPAGQRTPSEPEAAAALARDGLCMTDELEMGWYRGSEIRLDTVCLEWIALALPVKPLCREDCAGLCPRCGNDRNETPCQCGEVSPNSPFSVLAALRGGSSGGAK
jgi:uncharacterized metal-binding protein YceD (DUF177 family)